MRGRGLRLQSNRTAELPRILAVSLLMSAFALVLLAWLVSEVMRGRTIQLDNQVRTGLHAFASPALTMFFRVITQFGSPVVQIVGTPLIALTFWRVGWHRRAWLYLVAMSGGSLLLWVLKETFRRTRPEAYFGYQLPTSYSFPSGHALLSFCFYGVLAAFLIEHQKGIGRRIAISTAAVLLILLIGTSRIYLSVHYFTDVVAGYLAALIWSTGVAWAYHRLSQRNPGNVTATDAI